MNVIDIKRARLISEACTSPARAVPPAKPAPAFYKPLSFVDPADLPLTRELRPLEALTEWVDAGGDAAALAGRHADMDDTAEWATTQPMEMLP